MDYKHEQYTLYNSIGTLKYGSNYSLRLLIDPEIANYYRCFIPKKYNYNKPKYEPHISVVRKVVPTNLQHWGKYEDKQIEFQYDNNIHFGTQYIWLNCFSKELENIRLELGLSIHDEFTEPPQDYKKCFHTTLGNFK